MLKSEFIEDVFINFYRLVVSNPTKIQSQDIGPINSFFEKIICHHQLTQNQGNFLLKLLSKYKKISSDLGLDYDNNLNHVKWRTDFRVLDLSKKIYVEQTSYFPEICVKFPFQLKKEFETEIVIDDSLAKHSKWDHDQKIRRLNLYEFNLITLYEFALKHEFQIDDTFLKALSQVEEIWQAIDSIEQYSYIDDQQVILRNASHDVYSYWNTNKSGQIEKDLLLAKSMGFVLKSIPRTVVQKIASCKENTFWINNFEIFFQLVSKLDGKICILLDRSESILPWIQTFVHQAEVNGLDRKLIKVCFRENKENSTGLNEWIKLAGVGGKVDTGKILIFETKPPKWLFKTPIDVTMIVTNNVFPPTNVLTRDWCQHHPLVVYLGNTTPTGQKGNQIVKL